MGLYKQKFNPISQELNLVPTSTPDISGKEDVANKSVNTALGNSDTLYPSQKAVKAYVDALGVDASSIKDIFLNIMLNAFRIAQVGSLTIFGMIKGMMDEYESDSGIDLINSLNYEYNSSSDYFSPAMSDSNTLFLSHFDGTDGDTSADDISGRSHPINFNGNAELDDAYKKFGTTSLKLSSSGGWIHLPSSDDWNFGTGDFTIDFWMRPSLNGGETFIMVDPASDIGSYGFAAFMITQEAGGDCYIWASSTGTSWDIATGAIFSYGGLFNSSVWSHVAIVRNGVSLLFFVDGVNSGSLGLGSNALYHGTRGILFGRQAGGTIWNGWMDEIRISNVARWTSGFTPPINPYIVSASNMTLLSNANVADNVPTSARIILFEEDVDSITLNTDIKAYVSRDNGTTYSQVTLEDEGNYISTSRVLSGLVNITGQPSGTNMKYKIETLNTKNLKLHGTGLSWK